MEGLEVSAAFWRGKRVLVSGHTGFKGTWLCRWLSRLGARVVGYALTPATIPNLFDETGIEREIVSVIADVRDEDRLRHAMLEHDVEIAFHMAAQPLVSTSYAHPTETYSTNVMGTANLLEAVRTCPHVRTAVIVTSDKCYELRNAKTRYSEDNALGGCDPYSSSKACAEIITAAYRSSFFAQARNGASAATAVATARAGNVIGGGDWSPHRLIPDAMAAFAAGKPLILRNPKAIRPWQHVLDPLRGYLLLAQHLWEGGQEYAGAWNLGPPPAHELAVEALVAELAAAWGNDARWHSENAQSSFPETAVLRLNSDLALRRLGWRARVPISQALRMTASWYQAHLAGERATTLVDADIDRFEADTVP